MGEHRVKEAAHVKLKIQEDVAHVDDDCDVAHRLLHEKPSLPVSVRHE